MRKNPIAFGSCASMMFSCRNSSAAERRRSPCYDVRSPRSGRNWGLSTAVGGSGRAPCSSFNYVAPNRKRIGLNTKPGLFEAVAWRSFDTWCGVGFENLCLKNLPVVLENLGIPLESVLDFGPFFRQGSRGGDGEASKVGKGLQIDLVLRRKGGILTLIECKFRSRPVGLSVVRDMERKI